ncbi:tripartite tricarboxylate transporter permease [Alkalihalophilus lindianensis]|uniref:Tripartite tricarboxylate transporter permease n=1 Tax=Alkalihalophilus lindianensis TaxID=1630542 RepID=A0ABU3XE59_9BACI|nr:tripartite tricarboxylate transporter permease [Alkalihalophilus lindianensis]MDV2685593.1 tripartite tricarboxylate transporter permease [Alkalihalophilus lindianensis]
MELSLLMEGIVSIVTSPSTLLWCLIGITIGTLVGALPGIGSITAMAILLPITFGLSPLNALVLLISIYLGGQYGGRISSILINVPGDAGALVTTFDGYPMAKQGKAGQALTLSAIGSFIGGLIGFFGLVFFIGVISEFAIAFGPAEYFTLLIFALVATSGVTESKPIKSYISVALGLLLAMIGLDPVTGDQRMTFGTMELWDGISFVVVAIGIFGLSEVLMRLEQNKNSHTISSKLNLLSLFPKIVEVVKSLFSMVRGGIIGFLVGALPGAGASIATFLSYSFEKKISKEPETFGKGNHKGLSGPESASNASVGGALIPTFSLGVPGSASAAILLGGMMMVGLQPGPSLLTDSADIVWAAIATLFVANILLLVLNTLFVPFFSILIQKAEPYLTAVIACLCFIGVYAYRGSLFDVGLLIFFALVGYFMRKNGYPLAPLLLGMILCPMLEQAFRRALLLSDNNYLIFVSSPLAITFVILSLLIIILPRIQKMRKRKTDKSQLNM